MTAFGYPIALDLRGRRAVVIGEIAVREGKVEALVEGGAADVVVVAPGPLDRLDELERRHGHAVAVRRRGWRADDLDGAAVVVASGDDPADRSEIARRARERGALVNVMDDVDNCDWAAPAVVRRGDLVVAVSTGGRSPALASRLRGALAERLGPEWGRALDAIADVRDETAALLPDVRERSRRWRSALDLAEAESLAAQGRADELRRRLRSRLLGGRA